MCFWSMICEGGLSSHTKINTDMKEVDPEEVRDVLYTDILERSIGF